MAKIKTIDIWDGHQRRRVDVKFSARSNKFEIRIPEDLAVTLDNGEDLITADTCQEAEEAWTTRVKELAVLVVKREKVIVYEYEASRRKRPEHKKETGYRAQIEDQAHIDDFADGYHCGRDKKEVLWKGMKVRWSLADRVVAGGRTRYLEHGGNDEVNIRGEVMDWTAEREAFFKSVTESLEKIVKRASAILDAEPAKLSALLDSGAGKMLIGTDKGA